MTCRAGISSPGSTTSETTAMIMGIGIDLVEIDRIQDLAERHQSFLKRIFASCELKYCQGKKNPYPHLAARFAAKEAVFKALGTGWSLGLSWTDVAVENDMTGNPAIQLSNGAKCLADKLGVQKTHISLTHTGAYATAQVVIEG